MANVAIITGAAGLVGSASVRAFAASGFTCVGVDNDLRAVFFGPEGSTRSCRAALEREVPGYRHQAVDIRDAAALDRVFRDYRGEIRLVIHTAAQPSHDWAARDPQTDFAVNAVGTLNLLELTRQHAPEACFIFTSTNKVYGDSPNRLPLVEQDTRWEVDPAHPFAAHGIDESMSIDQSLHSVFGASKVAADVLTQEYGRYFGLKTGIFRGGCLTGPAHAGVELHGFLAYLMRCAVAGRPYTIWGYKGKQVRDNLHSADLVAAFHAFSQAPRAGEVYNMGGSRYSHCSMLEAIRLCEEISGRKLHVTLNEQNRRGDHIWYVSDVRKFQRHYPNWRYTRTMRDTLVEIFDAVRQHPSGG